MKTTAWVRTVALRLTVRPLTDTPGGGSSTVDDSTVGWGNTLALVLAWVLLARWASAAPSPAPDWGEEAEWLLPSPLVAGEPDS